jgi:predicted small integral membrane protein
MAAKRLLLQRACNFARPSGVYPYDGTDHQEENTMTTDTKAPVETRRERKASYRGASNAPVYGLGFIGALVYYIGHAATFWLGVLGFFKAIVWPAMLVYEALKYLGM